MNEPIDELHQQCLEARAEVRASFAWARQRASEWNLRACPHNWQRERND